MKHFIAEGRLPVVNFEAYHKTNKYMSFRLHYVGAEFRIDLLTLASGNDTWRQLDGNTGTDPNGSNVNDFVYHAEKHWISFTDGKGNKWQLDLTEYEYRPIPTFV